MMIGGDIDVDFDDDVNIGQLIKNVDKIYSFGKTSLLCPEIFMQHSGKCTILKVGVGGVQT